MRYARQMPQWKAEKARAMRLSPTPAENALWQALHPRPWGAKFRRQVPMLGFIADFYCAKAKLIVEADGPIHNAQYDARRDAIFREAGFSVLRFTNAQILRDLPAVLAEIQEFTDIAA